MDKTQRNNVLPVQPCYEIQGKFIINIWLTIQHSLRSLIHGSTILASVHSENQRFKLKTLTLLFNSSSVVPEIWGGGPCYAIPWEQSLLIQSY